MACSGLKGPDKLTAHPSPSKERETSLYIHPRIRRPLRRLLNPPSAESFCVGEKLSSLGNYFHLPHLRLWLNGVVNAFASPGQRNNSSAGLE